MGAIICGFEDVESRLSKPSSHRQSVSWLRSGEGAGAPRTPVQHDEWFAFFNFHPKSPVSIDQPQLPSFFHSVTSHIFAFVLISHFSPLAPPSKPQSILFSLCDVLVLVYSFLHVF
jgi:hypothetical protein